ncbi:hypothetical protein [Nonomuraea sp. NPDC003754]
MFGEGQLTRDERISLSNAIGEGLSAFNRIVAEKVPRLYERDLWDDITPSEPAAISETLHDELTTDPAPSEVAESGNEPGSSPTVENESEVGMSELTEDQARQLEAGTGSSGAVQQIHDLGPHPRRVPRRRHLGTLLAVPTSSDTAGSGRFSRRSA